MAFGFLKGFFAKLFGKGTVITAPEERKSGYFVGPGTGEVEEVHSVWDFLKFSENTQADHLNKVIGFEEWVEMEEIRRRIRELFGVDYKNERSLYPYLKALVDAGLFETSSIGGRRKWRKRDLIIKLRARKKAAEAEPAVEAERSA